MISSLGLRPLGVQGARPAAASTASDAGPGGILLPLLLPLAIAVLWELAAAGAWIEPRFFPPPSAVVETLRELAASGELLRHVSATLLRVVEGFGLGLAVATVLGAVTGYSTFARRLLDPTLQALRNIPSIAWVPLFILWFGIFEASKVALIAVGVFFPIYLGLLTGIEDVDRKLVEVGRAYELGPFAMIRRILLPAALPAYLTGLRSGLGLGWMFVIAAELMGASEGLGYLLIDGQMTGNAAQILASLVLFAVLGKATDSVLAVLLRRQLAWRDSFVRG